MCMLGASTPSLRLSAIQRLCPQLPFDIWELKGSLVAQKIAKIRNLAGYTLKNSSLLVKRSYSQNFRNVRMLVRQVPLVELSCCFLGSMAPSVKKYKLFEKPGV